MSTRSGRGRRRGRGSNSGWEEWGGYMPAKIQKLQKQFQSDQASSKSDIFKGIAIHVNGYTKPTSDELKHLMKEHGGVYHHYYSRSYVTHIIASNLPTSKIRQLTDQKVVKPEWITESVRAGKLLPYQDFLLVVKQTGIQKSLSRTTSKASSNITTLSAIAETRDSIVIDEESDVNPIDINDLDVVDERKKGEMTLSASEIDMSGPSRTEYESKVNNENETKEANQVKILKSPGKAIKAGDPNFVSEFYGHSRLHHIATWGAEYKAYVNELQAKGCTSFPGRDRLREYHNENTSCTPVGNMSTRMKGKPERVIMHVDMDCFFVSVGLRKRPDLIGKPVAVTHSKGKGAPKDRPGSSLAYEKDYYTRRKSGNKKGQEKKPDEVDLLFDDEADILAAEMKVAEPVDYKDDDVDAFHSMAEIASCSYEARAAGVKNGSFMGPAKKLCPELIAIPYDFEGYKEVSQILYDTVASYTYDIEAVSCDEMLVDCTDLLADTGATPDEFTTLLRQEIHDKTGCTASAGLGPNILMAKIATRKAKPNGQFWLELKDVQAFILDKPVGDLPGVGWTIRSKLQNLNVTTCGDLQAIPLSTLQKEFGPKNGQSLYNFCRGKDDRAIKVEKERKSVSAEINYGIRFSLDQEAERFLNELAEEVHNRLVKINMKGKTITLKLKVRKEGAPKETAKYLGHGVCDSVSKSTTLPVATDDPKIIGKESYSILRPLGIPVDDIRGIGISMTRLEAPIGSGKNSGLQTILNFATPVANKVKERNTSSISNMYTAKQINSSPYMENSLNLGADITSEDYELAEATEIPKETSPDGSRSPEIQMAGPVGINTSLPPLPMLPDFSSPESSQSSQSDSQPLSQEPPKHSTPQPSTSTANETPLPITPVSHHKPLNDEQFLISPSQVDPDVLQELPEDIRHQIEVVMNRQKKAKAKEIKSRTNVPMNTEEEQPGCSHWPQNNQPQLNIHEDEPRVGVDKTDEDDSIIPLPNLSQLDESCLNALPEDMQDEIREAYKQQGKSEKSKPEVYVTEPKSPTKPVVVPPLKLKQASPSKTSPKKSPVKSPFKGKSPSKMKSPQRGSPQFKVPQGRGPGRKKKLSPKKLKFNTQPRIDQPRIKLTPLRHETPSIEEQVPMDTDVVKGVHFCGAVSIEEVKSLMKEWITSCPAAPDGEDVGMVVTYMASLIEHKDLEKVYLLIKFLTRNIKKLDSDEWLIGLDTIISNTQALVVDSYGWQLKI